MLVVLIAPAVAVWQCRCYYMYRITYKCCVPLYQITLNFNDVRVTRAAFPFSVVRPAVARPPAWRTCSLCLHALRCSSFCRACLETNIFRCAVYTFYSWDSPHTSYFPYQQEMYRFLFVCLFDCDDVCACSHSGDILYQRKANVNWIYWTSLPVGAQSQLRNFLF